MYTSAMPSILGEQERTNQGDDKDLILSRVYVRSVHVHVHVPIASESTVMPDLLSSQC